MVYTDRDRGLLDHFRSGGSSRKKKKGTKPPTKAQEEQGADGVPYRSLPSWTRTMSPVRVGRRGRVRDSGPTASTSQQSEDL